MTQKKRLSHALALAVILGTAAPALADAGLAGSYLAARHASVENDFQASADYITRTLARDPGNAALLENAVITFVSLGDFGAAIPIARRLQSIDPVRQAGRIALLADLLHKEDYAAVLAQLEEGQAIGALVDGLMVAWAHLGEGRMSEALDAFDKLATAPGLQAFGLYHKGLALASVGDFEGADAIFSGQEGAGLRLTRRGAMAHAQILSQLERNADALAVLDEGFGTTADPGVVALRASLEAGETLPYTLVRNAADGQAEVFFTVATALNGEADHSYTLLYTRVAEYLRPDHTDATLMTAGLLEALGQYDLATEAYNRIPREDPAFHAAEIGRAEALYAAGNTEAAIEVMRQLQKAFPDLVVVNVTLGDMLRRQEKFADAAIAYDAAIALLGAPQPGHWSVYYSRAIANERAGIWDKAEPDFLQALELSPDQPQVLNYLGYSYVEKKEKLDEALAMIEKAVAGSPNSGFIIDSLGWVQYRLGRYDEAVENMERAVELMPVDAIVTDHLGDVYWAVGRQLEARFQWRRALSFDPEEAEAIRIRRKLEVGLDAVLAEEGAPPLVPVAANGN